MMYVRLLQHNPAAAARVVGCDKESVTNFSESAALSDKFVEQIFKEFNTLSAGPQGICHTRSFTSRLHLEHFLRDELGSGFSDKTA